MPQCKALIGTSRWCSWCGGEFEPIYRRQKCCGRECGKKHLHKKEREARAAESRKIGRPNNAPEDEEKPLPAFMPAIESRVKKLQDRFVIVETERVRHGVRVGWRDVKTGEIGGLWLAQDGEEKKAEIFAIVSLAKLASAVGFKEAAR